MKISVPKQEFEVNPEDLTAVEQFLSKIAPGFVKEFGGVLSDSVKGWRARNMIKILTRTKVLIEQSGLSQQELSGKFFVQAIEKASVEDDDTLQEKWAQLLSSAVSGKVQQDVKYISILSELSSIEVKLLDAISKGQVQSTPRVPEFIYSAEKVTEYLKISSVATKIMIDNFYRLNICHAPAMDGITVGSQKALVRTNETFTFTDLGRAFLSAVKG